MGALPRALPPVLCMLACVMHLKKNVSYSVNIKERLDFSCALFDPEGSLIANAPHVPVRKLNLTILNDSGSHELFLAFLGEERGSI